MTIIGIGHIARVGKDTAAEALVRDLGYRRVGFADALKELALEINPMVTGGANRNVGVGSNNLRHIVGGTANWEYAKDQFPEVRRFLENLGKACRKVFGDEVWLQKALEGNDLLGENLVIPDVRHLNEAEAIQALGGKVVRIDRPGHKVDKFRRPSETHLLDWTGWDGVIENTGDVKELEGKILEWVRSHAQDDPPVVPSPR